MFETDMLIRESQNAIREARKTMGEVSDLVRQRDRGRELVEGMSADTPEGRAEILRQARLEISHFSDNDSFYKLIDRLGMSYDGFVEHELRHLDVGSKEGRHQMMNMACVEMRNCGDSSYFREMLDKAGASYQEYEYFNRTGEMYQDR